LDILAFPGPVPCLWVKGGLATFIADDKLVTGF